MSGIIVETLRTQWLPIKGALVVSGDDRNTALITRASLMLALSVGDGGIDHLGETL